LCTFYMQYFTVFNDVGTTSSSEDACVGITAAGARVW